MASNSRMRAVTSVYYSCPWPTTGVIWLCACVKYWPYCGVGTCASVLKSVLTIRHLHISHNASCLPLPPSPSFPKFCMSIVFDFSWDGYKTQENWKTKVMQNFFFFGGGVHYGKCGSGVWCGRGLRGQRHQTRLQGRTLGTRLPAAHTQKKLNQGNTPRRKLQKPIPCEDKELIKYFKFFLQNNALDLKFLFSPTLVNMVRSPIF